MPDSIECHNDLVRFLASGQVDSNDSQCLDAKFHQNTNDYLLDHMILSNIKPCIYTDFINFDYRIDFHNSLFMMHFNIRSLQKNFDSFYEALQLLSTLPQIICISETKINKKPLTNISISNYSFVCANSNTRAGGVGFYLNNSISYKTIGKNLLKIAGCKDLWVSINFPGIRHTIIIAVIYRHPNSDANTFIEPLNKKLCEFERTNMIFTY